MSKNISKKLLFAFIIIFLFLTFFLTSQVNATEENIIEEEKIMKYDVITGITSEVNMQELEQAIYSTKSINGELITETNPYNPLEIHTPNNSIRPYAIFNRVSNTNIFPYVANCRIKGNTATGHMSGSGAMVGRKILLTAAHCVMDQNNNDVLFTNWVAYPGYNNGSSYQGLSSSAAQVYYSNMWTSTHSETYDWCICILNSDIGSSTGWYGVTSYGTSSSMNGLSVELYGYPANLNGGEYQYYSFGTISNARTNAFDCSARASTGFSGGPYTLSDYHIVGVAHAIWSDTTMSIGTAITQQMVNLIISNNQ